ncbi:MAG: hypothetical protein ABIH79_00045 [archaeon]
MNNLKRYWEKFWNFLHEDSWISFAVTLLLAFIIIKFVFFSGLSFVTGTSLPLVIVESCSMYHHEAGFEKIFESSVYEDYGITLEDTSDWDFKNGINKGDMIFVVAADNIKIGDVIIFNGGTTNPLIHRVIQVEDTYSTKGDNYKTNSKQLLSEKVIEEDRIIGKALFKVPVIGWTKLIFFEWTRVPNDRGLCK